MAVAHQLVTPSFRNILVATDFSHESAIAFRYAQVIARLQDSRMHALHVKGEYSYHVLGPEQLRSVKAAHSNAELKKLFQGVPKQMPMRHGDIWEMINNVVEHRHIDLLVVGTRARKGLDRLIRGSVAEDVLRYAHCPVLTVGPGVKLHGFAEPQIRTILLPTDFDPRSDSPRYAAWLCNELRAKLTVLHVSQEFSRRHAEVELAGVPGSAPDHLQPGGGQIGNHGKNARRWDPGVDTPMPGAGAKQLGKLMEETSLWCKPDSLLEYGEPSAKILEIARKLNPDLIVLGARFAEPEKLNSALARSTVTRVIAGAGCPVLTVRQKEI